MRRVREPSYDTRVAITRGPGRRCRNSKPENQPSVVRNSQHNSQHPTPWEPFRGRSVSRNASLVRACRFLADEGCDFAVVRAPRPPPARLALMLSYAYSLTRCCKEEAVKHRLGHDRGSEPSVSRREFLAEAGTPALGFTIVPRHVLGGKGYVPPSDKVNIAFIGVGSQGQRVMLNFLREPDVQGVAVCDPNRSGAGHTQWDTP